jgi:ATP-dependent helicase Lhr and Lhr-like helicase
LEADSTVAVLAGSGEVEWWTFGGSRANATLARALAQETRSKVSHDSFTLTFETAVKLQDVEQAIGAIRQQNVDEMRPAVDEAAVDGLKFSECLPIDLATEMLERRLQEPEATRQVLEEHVSFVVQ